MGGRREGEEGGGRGRWDVGGIIDVMHEYSVIMGRTRTGVYRVSQGLTRALGIVHNFSWLPVEDGSEMGRLSRSYLNSKTIPYMQDGSSYQIRLLDSRHLGSKTDPPYPLTHFPK